MKQTIPIRLTIVAEQIEDALKKRGLSRKQFADLMGRRPSEVTKWLSGKHNFTIALLQEISDVLGTSITGVEDVSALVEGYEVRSEDRALAEPVAMYGSGTELFYKIRRRSSELGISAKRYIEKLVDEDLKNSGAVPKIDLTLLESDVVERFAGIMKVQPSRDDLDNDERLSRIWNR